MASPTSSSSTLSPLPNEVKSRSPSRKQSHDDMDTVAEDRNPAVGPTRAEAVDDVENISQQNRDTATNPPAQDSSEQQEHDTMDLPIIQATSTAQPPPPISIDSSMPPPTTPSSTTQSRTQKPPRSGQGSPPGRKSPPATQNHQATTTAQKPANELCTDADTQVTHQGGSEDEDEDSADTGDPQDQIDAFDWQDLEQRYHDTMAELKRDEDGIIDEFHNLCKFFGVWASTTQTHEVNRSFKRLKTQTAFVQREESQLEEKRKQYIKVVGAFKLALDMLRDDL